MNEWEQRLLTILVGILLFLIYRWIQERVRKKVYQPVLCKPNAHQMRSIAAPYARQCRRCGVVEFREDANGNFPDGLREYFDYVKLENVRGLSDVTVNPTKMNYYGDIIIKEK